MNSKIKVISKVARNSLQVDLIKSLIIEAQKIKNDIEKYREFIFLNFFNDEQILKYERFMELEFDLGLSLQDRRERILFRLLSKRIFSPDNLKEQARIFTNGEIEVTEVFDEYYFIIKFTSIYGIPPNLNNFINFIELNKPAHLGYKIVYSYMTWDEFDRYNKTWDMWDGLNLNWEDREKYKEYLQYTLLLLILKESQKEINYLYIYNTLCYY